jgi:endonuclease/exonuclease/phosphatase (EEP) superfamily protein YafD
MALLAVAVVYLLRPPNFDPITIWPFGFWAGGCIILALILSPLLHPRRALLVGGIALIAALAVCEEPRYLLRSVAREPDREIAQARLDGSLVRVITLNCGGGDERAVTDALALDPDVLLLQETPGEVALESVVPEGWQRAGWLDPTIMVRGTLQADDLPRWLAHEMYVGVAVPERLGRPITIISTRLVHPSLRMDIWRPKVWRDAARVRKERAHVIADLLRQRLRHGEDLPVIIGGDFNTPGGDSLLRPLAQAGLRDVFAAAGRGWPNTITADFPVSRIDLIYASNVFRPLDARAVITPHSDHRMVVADMALR